MFHYTRDEKTKKKKKRENYKDKMEGNALLLFSGYTMENLLKTLYKLALFSINLSDMKLNM